MDISAEDIAALDARHIWHPYAEPGEPTLVVDSAAGVHLTLADGTTLIDAMSSGGPPPTATDTRDSKQQRPHKSSE